MLKKWRILRKNSLQARMLLFFFSIFLIIILLLILPWGLYMQYTSQRDTKTLAQQQLHGLDTSLLLTMQNLYSNVDVLLLNRSVEDNLENIDSLEQKRFITDVLRRFLINDLDLSLAVFISDDGTVSRASSSDDGYNVFPENLDVWECDLQTNKMFVLPHGGGVVESKSNDSSFLSFVRTVNSVTDFKRLGVVILNIDAKRFGKIIQDYIGETSQVYLLDAEGEIAAQTPNATLTPEKIATYQKWRGEVRIVEDDGVRRVVCQYESGMNGLILLSVTALAESHTALYNYQTMMLIALLSVVMIFIGQLYLSRSISRPLTEMCEHMNMAEKGDFAPIQVRSEKSDDEIKQLQIFFNRMVIAIDALVVDVGEKERMKRKHEVARLQEQMKPHFLYNALGAVSALSLIGDNQTAHTLSQALSAFYRNSLSGGREVIPVRTELECIENYMTVLNIRYKNEIKIHYDIDTDLYDQKIIRMILQPLVENAVYHGIRKRRGAENIWVSGRFLQNEIEFSVEDDGAGITKERIQQVLTKQAREMEKGFALYNLIEKLELFYGVKNLLAIKNRDDYGVQVTITVPVLGVEMEPGDG